MFFSKKSYAYPDCSYDPYPIDLDKNDLYFSILYFFIKNVAEYLIFSINNNVIIFFIVAILLAILILFKRKIVIGNKVISLLIMIFILSVIMGIAVLSTEGTAEYIYKVNKCDSSGGQIRKNACEKIWCESPTQDYGKKCNNDNDCEKYCVIDNASEIIKAWQQNYSNVECVQVFYEDVESCNFKQVKLSDWYKKTGIKVKGTCSGFYNKDYEKACSALYSQGVSVQKGGRWSNYPGEELLKVEAGCGKKFNDEMYEKMMNRARK